MIPFGGSDNDAISYVRYSKPPTSPARTVRKRSYKNFDQAVFFSELSKVDWNVVYQCTSVDLCVEVLTRKFVEVLNIHAPWVVFQQRKNYAPWITKETIQLMKERDDLKKSAELFALNEDTDEAELAWSQFKVIRNKVNNRKDFEEIHFKTEKINQSLDFPANS